jgi:hypothetical protein
MKLSCIKCSLMKALWLRNIIWLSRPASRLAKILVNCFAKLSNMLFCQRTFIFQISLTIFWCFTFIVHRSYCHLMMLLMLRGIFSRKCFFVKYLLIEWAIVIWPGLYHVIVKERLMWWQETKKALRLVQFFVNYISMYNLYDVVPLLALFQLVQ